MKTQEMPFTKFPTVQEIIQKVEKVSFKLEQDTEDTAQLNPVERLSSINEVWRNCKEKIGKPTLALDVGSGFGYGTVFLESQNIKTIGIENVSKKIKQGKDFFKTIGINISNTTRLDFTQHPAFYEGDITSIHDSEVKVDLITLFYLSLKMISQPETFKTLQKLLKRDGVILLSTQAEAKEVKVFLENNPIHISSTYEIIEIPNNFEKTAILLKFK